jgi:carotenoid cleavage dioxygenase-like enzyme
MMSPPSPVRFSVDLSQPEGTMMNEEELLTTNTMEFPTFNRDCFAKPYSYIYASNMKYEVHGRRRLVMIIVVSS